MQGSHLVKEVREKKESNKSRARFWEVAGSKMGQITGALRGAVSSPAVMVILGLRCQSRSVHSRRALLALSSARMYLPSAVQQLPRNGFQPTLQA